MSHVNGLQVLLSVLDYLVLVHKYFSSFRQYISLARHDIYVADFWTLYEPF